MNEASLYQALRGHLATLRLAAAAEALPGVLEAGRAENLGPTALLERLLGIEVKATEARRHASLERFASLPAPWRLSDFDFDAQPAVDRALVNELGTLRFLEDATNVLFIGPPGVGKTMLAVALGRASVEGGYTGPTTRPPPSSPHAVIERRSRAAGRRRCASMRVRAS
jgi:DNA replication protein DnaC